jgi:ATP-dependent DNA helicase RecG
MERRGSGFKKIMDDYKFQENYTEKLKPEFYAKYDSFILTLYNLNYLEGQDDAQDGTQGDTQDVPQSGTHDGTHDGTHNGTHDKMDLDEQIIELIRNNPNITQAEIAKKTNTSLRTIKRHTVAISKIAYVGSGDKGHWEVTDNE